MATPAQAAVTDATTFRRNQEASEVSHVIGQYKKLQEVFPNMEPDKIISELGSILDRMQTMSQPDMKIPTGAERQAG